MPVCARCTGIYVGAAVSALALPFVARRKPTRSKGALPFARSVLIVAAVPTVATLLYEWTTGLMPANWIRAAAGVPIGVVVAWIVLRLRPERAEG